MQLCKDFHESLFKFEDILLEQILGAGPEPELLVDLEVQFGPLALQLPSAGGSTGVTALTTEHFRPVKDYRSVMVMSRKC